MSVLPSLPDSLYPSIQEIDVSESDMFSLLSQLDYHKAGGPDHVAARVLEKLAYDLWLLIYLSSHLMWLSYHKNESLLLSSQYSIYKGQKI